MKIKTSVWQKNQSVEQIDISQSGKKSLPFVLQTKG